jgi:thiol:disulfide interchange protein DsbD
VIQNNASPSIQAERITLPISSERMDSPQRMAWLLVQGTANAPTGKQWVLETPVQGKWQEWTETPAALSTGNVNLQLGSAPASVSAAPWATWMLAVLGAFLGGMLLNFMPCVFPVLAIKLLGITQHSGNQRTMRLSAWAFSVGVLISFLLLGGLMLALRAAGSQMGWGFQLQSPWVVGALAFLFVVMGLNLSGLFEFGHFVPSSVASFQFANPATNSLWSGVFAVVIASPCTAPFMGASLGLAIGFPAWQALPIFGAMGLGMALPFLLVSISSGWLKFLPKPGAWMNTFRHVMAIPMYATAIWLVWVLGLQTGWWDNTPEAAPTSVSAASNQDTATRPSIVWEAWSDDKVRTARQAGRPVFIDFTAAWCVTCQFNKKTTFADANLLKDFAQKNVLLLRADWTRYDPAITKALNNLGRNGLPVYAWYAPGKEVLILSELPSVQEVQNALSQVATN